MNELWVAVLQLLRVFHIFMEEFKPILQILIPQYNEGEEVIKHLLNSIAVQQHVDLKKDISVIIVNDGSDTILTKEFLDKYPYKIEYILSDHEGVSTARNIAFDYSVGDYVMWCDADDMFYTTHAIWIILNTIKKTNFDAMNSTFLEELRYTDGSFAELMKHEHDRTFVHGKVYKRSFLVENDIRWNPKLSIHEDVFFNTQALVLAKNLQYQDNYFYVWKCRNESICRNDPDYTLKTYPNLTESNDALIEIFLKKDHPEAARQNMVFVIFDAYYSMQLPTWHTLEHLDHRKAAEKHLALLWDKYKNLFWETDVNYRAKTASAIRDRLVKNGMVMEIISFPDWVGHLENLIKEEE